MIIRIKPGANGLAEDKDEARELRLSAVLPALEKGDKVVLDFSEVGFATQSFVHALIGEALQRHKIGVLDLLEFRSCSSTVRSVIELVVDYSLGGFAAEQAS